MTNIEVIAQNEPVIRESFVYYRSFAEASSKLSAEDFKTITLALADYGFDGVVPELPVHLDVMFMLMKPQIDANKKKYLNGKKGGAPKGNKNASKSKNNQKQPNVNVNVNVTDNDNEKENDKVAVVPWSTEKEERETVFKMSNGKIRLKTGDENYLKNKYNDSEIREAVQIVMADHRGEKHDKSKWYDILRETLRSR